MKAFEGRKNSEWMSVGGKGMEAFIILYSREAD
jgi:hypothetical protein